MVQSSGLADKEHEETDAYEMPPGTGICPGCEQLIYFDEVHYCPAENDPDSEPGGPDFDGEVYEGVRE